MKYQDFIAKKALVDPSTGMDELPELSAHLFEYQRDIVSWSLRKGRCAIFADCGLGKTLMQLEWAHHVSVYTGQPVLILAPLAVAEQTVEEGRRFGFDVTRCYSGGDVVEGINIANYERLHLFDPSDFGGVVLDESSILKAYDSKTRNAIIDGFRETAWRLACTATPSPNDHMELGNHAEFVGAMTRAEMLAMFFVHDGGRTSQWRLKGHATDAFWRWVSSWAVLVRSPSDLGYCDAGFDLPELRTHEHILATDTAPDGFLFAVAAESLRERQTARKSTLDERVSKVAELVNNGDTWVVWCDFNAESEALTAAIDGAVEIKGADAPDDKARRLVDFSEGRTRVLVTKPSIAGFGLNWQHCSNMAFCGLSDSYEQFYQAVRRCWRFGQKMPVDVHIVTTDRSTSVLRNIKRKADAHEEMSAEMARFVSVHQEGIKGMGHDKSEYERDVARGESWTMHLGDCVEVVGEMDAESIDYSIFSPPFASLYTYSNSDRDMGNCKGTDDFGEHFAYLVRELYRVTKPGRLLSFHCMNLPTSKARDGYIGIRDFRGQLIRIFQDEGWIYHSEVTIWKDPVTAMQRTKALGLLYKQLRKDSAMSRQGIADYLVTMRKPGTNASPVTHTPDDFPLDDWQNYASPVWMDIDPQDTLNYREAREEDDERHICPLQLGVIQRALHMWSRPGDLVLSPFGGIGSEGFQCIQQGRRFVGAELKRSYWAQAVKNLTNAERAGIQQDLFCEVAS